MSPSPASRPAALPGTLEFARFFAASKAVDGAGYPLLVYRGEHGNGRPLHGRLGSLTFGDRKTALLYASEPNNRNDIVKDPRVLSAYVSIQRPLISDPEDPFLDFRVLAGAIGPKAAETVALKFSSRVEETGVWAEEMAPRFASLEALLAVSPGRLMELYVPAYIVLDDAESVGLIRAAGFDGAIHGGSGANSGEAEYNVFDRSQVRVVAMEKLTPGQVSELDPVPASARRETRPTVEAGIDIAA